MGKTKSLKMNFVMNSVLTMSQFIFPLMTFPYVSRILSPTGIGKVSFATSIISYFLMFAQLGIPTYGIRACARVRDDRVELSKTAHEIFVINSVMCLASYMLLLGATSWIPRLATDRTLILIVSLMIFFNTLGMEWLYKALEQYTYITVRSILFKIIALIAMFLLIHDQEDYVMYGGISIFASSASSVCNFINARKHIDIHPLGGYCFKRHYKAIAIFFAMSCATTIYTNMDTIMLGFMATDADVGYYNAAVKIKTILVSIVTSLGAVLLPRTSYYIEHGMRGEFERISQKALNFVMVLAAPLAIYFILYAQEGIYFLSGEAYQGSVLPMQIIMPTLVFIGLTNIMGIQILVPLGKEKTVLYSEIIGGAINLVINALLIPALTSAGAAIGTLVAEGAVWGAQFYALRDSISRVYAQFNYKAIALAVAAAIAVAYPVKFLNLNLFFALAISACVFFGIYFSVLTLVKEPLVLELEQTVLRKLNCRKRTEGDMQ